MLILKLQNCLTHTEKCWGERHEVVLLPYFTQDCSLVGLSSSAPVERDTEPLVPLLCSPGQRWLKLITLPLLFNKLHGVASGTANHWGMSVFWQTAHGQSKEQKVRRQLLARSPPKHLRNPGWGCRCRTPSTGTAAKSWGKPTTNHCIPAKALFGEMLSTQVHSGCFVLLPKRHGLHFSPLRKGTSSSLSEAQGMLCLPAVQHFCFINSVLWGSEIWPLWQDTGLSAEATIWPLPSTHVVLTGSPGTKKPFYREATGASESPINVYREIS